MDQINPGNVAGLRPVWVFHTGVGTEETSFESQPIVVEGTLYISSPHDHVYALDAATGALKWTYNPEMPALYDMAICCGQTNRGVAVGSGKVFIGQLDGMLAALDANTGQVVWKTAVDDWRHRRTETMAPQYVDGKVLIGGSGGEYLMEPNQVRHNIALAAPFWVGRRRWLLGGRPGGLRGAYDAYAAGQLHFLVRHQHAPRPGHDRPGGRGCQQPAERHAGNAPLRHLHGRRILPAA